MLIGLPGVGKLTVARELASRMPAILFDNESVNSPVYRLVDPELLAKGEKSTFPDALWQQKFNIRQAMIEIIVGYGKPDASYVFTNALYAGLERDLKTFTLIQSAADRCGAFFQPVVLECAREEHLRRLGSTARAETGKLTDTAMIAKKLEQGLSPLHPLSSATLILDVTQLSPTEAAGRILGHIQSSRRSGFLCAAKLESGGP